MSNTFPTMSKTPPTISEDTELTMNLKTISIIIVAVIGLATGYFTLTNKIDKAEERGADALTKVEFNISQEAVKQIVRETQGHIRDGHTTMYQMILENVRKEIIEAKKEVITEVRRKK